MLPITMSPRKFPRLLGAGLLMAGVLAVVTGQPRAALAFAADRFKPATVDVKRPAVRVKLDGKAVRTHKKAAIAHRPFALQDPTTKKALAANAMLTLPDGKKVKVGEYFAELNRACRARRACATSWASGRSRRRPRSPPSSTPGSTARRPLTTWWPGPASAATSS